MRHYLAEAAERELGFDLDYSAGIAMRDGPDDTLPALLKRPRTLLGCGVSVGVATTIRPAASRYASCTTK